MAVANTIHNLGLEQYYQQRDNKPLRPATASIDTHTAAVPFADDGRALPDGQHEIQLFIPDIHCTSCCWLIEKRLQQLPGVTTVTAQFHSHKLTLRWHKNLCSLNEIALTLHHIGYNALPWQPSMRQQTGQQQQKKLLLRLGVAGLLAMQIHMVAMGDYFGADANIQQWLNAVALLMSLPLWFYSADIFFINAGKNLRNLFQHQNNTAASMDLPVALAISAAAIASIIAVIRGTNDVYFDSIAMFVFLLLGARFLEARARNRLANHAQEPVLPRSCVRLRDGNSENNSTDNQETIHTQQLQKQDCVLVTQGIIPVDGKVLHGTASIEQAVITGEFLPVQKRTGDQVLAGTTLLSGNLVVQAEHWGENSHLADLHRRMEQSLLNKQQRGSSTPTLYDRIARAFTPVVLLLASAAALFWYWVDPGKALPAFLAVLVASCPCALTLAVPTALTAATLQLRRRGILITGQHVLPLLPRVTDYVFDKTGTLTQGRMHIVHTRTVGQRTAADCLALAAAMERGSSHPVANAFSNAANAKTLSNNDFYFSDASITSIVHCGIEAQQDGKFFRLGKQSWAYPHAVNAIPPTADACQQLYLTENDTLLAVFSLGDPLRDTARTCLDALREQGIRCIMATGDHSGAVDAVATALAITDVHSNCAPEQKVQLIQALQQQNTTALMVGDGVNDGPVLAHADISVALAEASQTAQLAADMILLNNRLDDLLLARTVALQTRRIARQNIIWALLYNLSILPLAAAGWLPPVYAAIGMALSSLLVTLNALRLLPQNHPQPKDKPGVTLNR